MKGGGTESHGYQGWSGNCGGSLLDPARRRESRKGLSPQLAGGLGSLTQVTGEAGPTWERKDYSSVPRMGEPFIQHWISPVAPPLPHKASSSVWPRGTPAEGQRVGREQGRGLDSRPLSAGLPRWLHSSAEVALHLGVAPLHVPPYRFCYQSVGRPLLSLLGVGSLTQGQCPAVLVLRPYTMYAISPTLPS